jgi:murein DD-endopeptidase MepM/ murein hydrolase activator NlpD
VPRSHRAAGALVALVVALLASPPPAGGQVAVTYRPPVDAPVIDPFRAPTSPYGPGNRGIDYATVPGTPVRAIGPGTVQFAGSVAGIRYVTVLHPDGLRSSYGGLATIDVIEGDVVVGGATIATAGDTLHLGVRRGDEYLDPQTLFDQAPPAVRLIPVREFDEAA